jgi:hypothetical protein
VRAKLDVGDLVAVGHLHAAPANPQGCGDPRIGSRPFG